MVPLMLVQHGIFYYDSVGYKRTLWFILSDLIHTPVHATPDAVYFHSGVRGRNYLPACSIFSCNGLMMGFVAQQCRSGDVNNFSVITFSVGFLSYK